MGMSSLGKYEPLAFLKWTCMPCFWGQESVVSSAVNIDAAVNDTIIELTIENKVSKTSVLGKSLYVYRGSSACWGIPGLEPLMDGSWKVVPDEKNTVCPSSDKVFDYYQALIVGLNFGYGWDFK